MKKIVIITVNVFLVLFFLSCTEDHITRQLNEVEELLREKKNTESLEKLQGIDPDILTNEEHVARYWLYKIQADYRLDNPVTSDKPLDQCIDYFERHHQYERLAWAYYYKGSLLSDADHQDQAVLYMKKAEYILLQHPEIKHLSVSVYQSLTAYNMSAGEYQLASKYGKKSMVHAIEEKDTLNMACGYTNISSIYLCLGMKDSALYYINKVIPLIDAIPPNRQGDYYTNLGIVYTYFDVEKSKAYLKKAIEINNDPYALRSLSSILKKEGKAEIVYSIAEKAARTKDLNLRIHALEDIYDMRMAEGDYKEASELSKQIMQLKDSLVIQTKERDIKGLQEQFDQERKEIQKNHQITNLLWSSGMVLMILLLVSMFLYHKNKMNRNKLAKAVHENNDYMQMIKQLKEENERMKTLDTEMVEKLKLARERVVELNDLQRSGNIRDNDSQQALQQELEEKKRIIAESERQIAAYEQSITQREQVIDELNKKISVIQHQQLRMIGKGEKLYEHVRGGGTIVTWTKNDIQNFIEYYRINNMAFVNQLETDYDHLSPRYKFFLILYHMGYNDTEVKRILGISDGTLRTNKHRIREKQWVQS